MFFPKEEVGRVPMDRRCSVAECYQFHFHIWVNTLQTSDINWKSPDSHPAPCFTEETSSKFSALQELRPEVCASQPGVLSKTWLPLLGEGDCYHIEDSTHYSEATRLLQESGVVSGHSGGLAP